MDNQPIFVRGRFPPWGVEALRGVFGMLFALLTRVEVRGLERLPASGGFIVSPNHLSYFDAPLTFVLLRGRKMTAFAADTYRANIFFRWVVESVDTIWVHRGAIPPSTLKFAIQALREGSILGLAPEGTRSPTHVLQKGRTGAAFLAMTTGAPVVPLAFTNTEKIAPGLKRFQRVKVTATFGEPLIFPEPPRHEREAKLEEYTTEIMCRIAALLPEEYRGVYAEHPRLKELLETGDR